MLPEKEDMTDSDLSSEDSLNSPDSSEGEKGSLKSEEKYIDLIKKKDKAISDLREQVSEIREKQERIDELENKKRLTGDQQDELDSLQDQITAIRRDKLSKAWLEINKGISQEVSKAELDSLDLSYAEEFVEEMAEQEKSDIDTFYPKIKKFMRKVDPEASMRLLTRAKKAYKLMKHEEHLSNREKAIAEKEKQFLEVGGSRQPRTQSREELINWKESKDPKEALSSLLKGISDAQEAGMAK